MTDDLLQYVIYNDRTRDFPGLWPVREWIIRPGFYGGRPIACLCASLKEAREQIPEGMVCLPRYEGDDAVIVEVWI